MCVICWTQSCVCRCVASQALPCRTGCRGLWRGAANASRVTLSCSCCRLVSVTLKGRHSKNCEPLWSRDRSTQRLHAVHTANSGTPASQRRCGESPPLPRACWPPCSRALEPAAHQSQPDPPHSIMCGLKGNVQAECPQPPSGRVAWAAVSLRGRAGGWGRVARHRPKAQGLTV